MKQPIQPIYTLSAWLILWLFGLLFFRVMPGFAIEPVLRAGFDQTEFSQTGWIAVPAGSGEFTLAPLTLSAIPASPADPGLTNGRGVLVSAQTGQGSLVLGPVVPTGGEVAVLSVSILTSSPDAIVAVGALDVQPDGSPATVDGSATFVFESNGSAFTEGYRRVRVIYQPKSNALIPLFQIAVDPSNEDGFATAMIDNYQVHLLNRDVVQDPELQQILGLTSSQPLPPTPTPTITPPPPSEPVPTATPTVMPIVSRITDFNLTNLNDDLESFFPAAAHVGDDEFAVTAVDQTGGFDDISLWNIGTDPREVRGPVTVNETFEETRTGEPDISITADRVRHIVWTDNRSIEKLFSIFLAQYNNNGARIGDADFEVNRLFVDTNTGRPSIDTPVDNEILITWIDDRNFVNDVFVRRLSWENNRLDPLGEEDFQINIPFENTVADAPDIAGDPDGNVIAVWTDNRLILGDEKRFDIYARVFRLDTPIQNDGTLPDSAQEIQVSLLDDQPDNSFDPRIAYDPVTGLFLVVWENFSQVRNHGRVQGAVLDSSGNRVQEEFDISDLNVGEFVRFPDVSSMGDGRFLVTWQLEDRSVVYGRVYDVENHRFLTIPTPLTPAPETAFNTGFSTRQRTAAGISNRFLSVFDGVRSGFADVSGFVGRINPTDAFAGLPAVVSAAVSATPPRDRVSISSENKRSEPHRKENRKPAPPSAQR